MGAQSRPSRRRFSEIHGRGPFGSQMCAPGGPRWAPAASLRASRPWPLKGKEVNPGSVEASGVAGHRRSAPCARRTSRGPHRGGHSPFTIGVGTSRKRELRPVNIRDSPAEIPPPAKKTRNPGKAPGAPSAVASPHNFAEAPASPPPGLSLCSPGPSGPGRDGAHSW